MNEFAEKLDEVKLTKVLVDVYPGLLMKIKAVVAAAINKVRSPDQSQKVWLTCPKYTPRKKMMIKAVPKADSRGSVPKGLTDGANHKGRRITREMAKGVMPLTNAINIGSRRAAWPYADLPKSVTIACSNSRSSCCFSAASLI